MQLPYWQDRHPSLRHLAIACHAVLHFMPNAVTDPDTKAGLVQKFGDGMVDNCRMHKFSFGDVARSPRNSEHLGTYHTGSPGFMSKKDS